MTTTANRSLSSRGGEKKRATVSQTHFGTIIFFFCFPSSSSSFFKLVSMRGKVEESLFQYPVVRCLMHANQALGSAVVPTNRQTPPQPNSCACGLALGWCIPI